ncbi:sigma factor-like helix-turn-helix DNA-binding protein [Desmospora profundinema]|uniref:RNA polymerase sigma-70 factor (ECF subfamily) n=1 Tax=Desmospora profundinema TaxID=1571184 RepID=A0ABU1IKZ6_9BACL|nr:sigma factor-like helix-turn-helix DNA-binding protein [Desmospora profundinema]MDR6225446.1 RNA polymerase sigma-70 factor (ECF subfamily) [Desmospora profundinema]
MKEWIQEYRESLERVRKAKKNLPKGPRGEADRRLLNDMERDLVWVIEWLSNGCQPGNRRGMENRSYDQREVLWSRLSEKAKRKIEWRENLKPAGTSRSPQWLEQLPKLLSDSEYEAFVAVRGQALSFGRAASLLHCSKSTVQSYVRRAEKKLRQAVAEGRLHPGDSSGLKRVR